MKPTKQREIYNSDYYETYADESARRDFCEYSGNESVSDDEWAEYCCEENIEWYEAERLNLKIHVSGCIVGFAVLQLWNRKANGAAVMGDNIADILNHGCNYDAARWYADAHNVRAELSHHDGTHRVIYRFAKSEEAARELSSAWINNRVDMRYIIKHTQSLRPYVAAVYGWSKPRRRGNVNAVIDYSLRFDADGTAYRQRVTIALTARQVSALNRQIKIARIAEPGGLNGLKVVGEGENYTTDTAARLLAQYFGLSKNPRYKRDRNTVYNFQIVNK